MTVYFSKTENSIYRLF